MWYIVPDVCGVPAYSGCLYVVPFIVFKLLLFQQYSHSALAGMIVIRHVIERPFLIFLRLRLSFKGLWSDFFMGLFAILCRPSGRLAHSPLASSGISQFLNLMIYISPFPTIRAVSKSSLVTLSPFLI